MEVSHLQSINQRLTAHMEVRPVGGDLEPPGFGGDQGVFVCLRCCQRRSGV